MLAATFSFLIPPETWKVVAELRRYWCIAVASRHVFMLSVLMLLIVTG